MKDRIRQVMEWAQLSQQDFAARLDISPASLSNILTGRTNPTNTYIRAIHRVFPEINVNWLMFDEGTMLEGSSVVADGTSPSAQPNHLNEAISPTDRKSVV